jgi:hypothetical protein
MMIAPDRNRVSGDCLILWLPSLLQISREAARREALLAAEKAYAAVEH